jgi:hypothetical protein
MHMVHPREASKKASKSFTVRYAEGKSYTHTHTQKKGEKREKSIWVNTKYHTKTDRAISGTLGSDTEKYCYQGWPDRSGSQGWRKHECLPRQR